MYSTWACCMYKQAFGGLWSCCPEGCQLITTRNVASADQGVDTLHMTVSVKQLLSDDDLAALPKQQLLQYLRAPDYVSLRYPTTPQKAYGFRALTPICSVFVL